MELDIGFAVHGCLKQVIQVTKNGILKFDTLRLSPVPMASGINNDILAAGPFWADIDLNNQNGGIYYKLFKETVDEDVSVLQKIDAYVRKH